MLSDTRYNGKMQFGSGIFLNDLIELTVETRLLEFLSQNYAFVFLRDKIFYKQ